MLWEEKRRKEYWEGVLTGKSLITEKGMSASCVVLSLSYGEWCVVMAWMLTLKGSRLMGRLELVAEECYFRRISSKASL